MLVNPKKRGLSSLIRASENCCKEQTVLWEEVKCLKEASLTAQLPLKERQFPQSKYVFPVASYLQPRLLLYFHTVLGFYESG